MIFCFLRTFFYDPSVVADSSGDTRKKGQSRFDQWKRQRIGGMEGRYHNEG
jgi:hypothetical protein